MTYGTGKFRLLAECIPCPVEDAQLPHHSSQQERRVWTWLTKAGIRLTTSELIRLEAQNTSPSEHLLGECGRQDLTNLIYGTDIICDCCLDTLMERSPARDGTVASLLRLLHHRCLILV